MDHDIIKYLRDHNPTVRLLRLDNAPLIISFLFQEFKKNNRIVISNTQLITGLSDYLYNLKQSYGEDAYPGTAQNYLDKWSNDGFLRKYYTPNSDEPVFELTPATEKALDWIKDLDKKEFVGTESRLLKIFDILKEIVYKSSDDPDIRLEELERQKQDIEREIEKIQSGNIDRLNETQIKERFFDFHDTARKLLSDFRQIEYNFRELDRSVREKQVNSNLKKGKLLEDIFKVQDLIWDTDQGRSFKAFWEFLMSRHKQDELSELIEAVVNLPEIQKVKQDDFIERIKVNLIDAGDKVNKTNHHLIEQLRKYLDDRTYLENKRIVEIIVGIKSLAIQVKDNPPKNRDFLLLDDRPGIELIMERPLFNVRKNTEIKNIEFEEGYAGSIDTDALYKQLYIDQEELKIKIREMLKFNSQVTLKQITEIYPVEKGLSEIITYLNIASKDKKSFIDDTVIEKITISNKETNKYFEIQVPQVIFCK
ncbi:signal transduction protein [Candidatus Methanoperedens nitroreducens]|uniref:Signal transduction protein n=1 Tax=Candidatus Methanoperedens nitratireducens TaxID=1392998 RepID=A0A062V8F0_9EURY|nr:DUF3375 domain-containing protein [Candidatus Methanoperedens nitroreducens]KCZ72029.1 signal transduction protein [Candidatus Methanoperedens nitroreducens]MDJ1421996.1 DUF3375 domain-containing protein [Candidatus Methanoperedens sp.]